ncbi:MAG: hypothetical protein WC788_01200 [Candidatus Paceibacterota bacterium]
MSNVISRLLELLFGKKFGLKEARLLQEALEDGKKVSIDTVTAMLNILDVENTVKADIQKEVAMMTKEVSELSTANTQITTAEEQAEKALLEQIEQLRKAREEAATEAEEVVAANTAAKKDLQENIEETNSLAIYG